MPPGPTPDDLVHPGFEVRRDVQHEDVAVLVLHGELDIATVGALHDAVAEIPAEQPLVLDLGALRFTDSSGLKAFITLQRAAHQSGRPLAFVVAGRNVQRTFELSGLLAALPFADTRDAALTAVRP